MRLPASATALIGLIVTGQIVAMAVEPARFDITAISMMLLDILGVIYGLRAVRRGANRTTWLSITVARALSIVSTACLVNAVHLAASGWWWTGTVTGLLTYVAMAVAAVSVSAQRLAGRQHAAFVAELLTVAGGGFMFIWHLVLDPLVDFGLRGHWLVLAAGLPLGDLLVLVAVAAFVLRGGFTRAARPVSLLIAGLAAYLVADLLFDSAGSDGIHTTGPRPATFSIVLATLVRTLAVRWQATAPEAPAEAASSPVPPAWASYFPYAATAAGFVLMITVTVTEDQLLNWGGLVLGLIVMTGAVAVRQLLSLRDSRDQIVTDPLTGLANRVAIRHALARPCAAASRSPRWPSTWTASDRSTTCTGTAWATCC